MASPGSHSKEVRDGRTPLSWYPHPGPVGPHFFPARDKHLGAPCSPPTEAEGEPLPWGPLGLVGTWLSWGAGAGCSTAVDPCRDEEPCLTFSGHITRGGAQAPPEGRPRRTALLAHVQPASPELTTRKAACWDRVSPRGPGALGAL